MTKRKPVDQHKRPGRPRKNQGETSEISENPGRDIQVEPKTRTGRPNKLIADPATIKLVEILAAAHCTQEEAAAHLKVAKNTFLSFLNDNPDVKAVWDEGRANGRANLRAWQFKSAQRGNTQMLVWLGKQLLGQKDTSKVESVGADGAPIQHEVKVTLSDAERAAVKAFLGEPDA